MDSEFQAALEALNASIHAAEGNRNLLAEIGAIRDKVLGYGALYRPHQAAIAQLLRALRDGGYGQCPLAELHLDAAYEAFERAFVANNSLQARRP